METTFQEAEFWKEFYESEKIRIEEEKIHNEKIMNEILSLKSEKFIEAIKEVINEDCKPSGQLELVKNKFGEEQKGFNMIKKYWVDQYCGYSVDDFSGHIYIPVKRNLYLKVYYER